MTNTEIDNLYSENVNLIRKVVWNFIKDKQLPAQEFDEYLCQANLYFMVAATSFDIDKAKFSTWLQTQIETRLYTQLRKDRREWEKLHFPRERDVQTSISIRPPIFWLDELNEDAKVLITLICDGTLDGLILDDSGVFEHFHGVKYVYKFLREWGWKRTRIRRCFKNIKDTLFAKE